MTAPMPESVPLGSAAEWHAFLNSEIEKTCGAYLSKPRLVVRDAKDERQISDDYAGRELLELLQNAADAAAELGGGGRVRIEVTRDCLFVANTGQPFRSTGVESLMTAHVSDKPQRSKALIGAKGLGFRSILNWSREPMISSGALEIAFSAGYALQVISTLGCKKPEISAVFENARLQGKPQVPVLPFPLFGDTLDQAASTTTRGLRKVVQRLRADGFDTVIAAPFAGSSAFEEAVAQAKEFEPRFLLFVEALACIEIELPDCPRRIWTRDEGTGGICDLVITDGDETRTERWICRRTSGHLPDELHDDPDSPSRYELAVALRVDQANKAGHLHCFFPTDVSLPLSALFHATLELQSNRKHLKDKSRANTYVLTALANFYAKVLNDLGISKRLKDPLGFLTPTTDAFPPPLSSFYSQLYVAAAQYPLVPTSDNRLVTPNEARLGPKVAKEFLPPRFFPRLAKYSGERQRQVLERLGVSALTPDEIIDVLTSTELSLEERADAIVGLLAFKLEHQPTRLLLDETGKPLHEGDICFPMARADALPKLPDWARVRFLNPGLWDHLSKRLGGEQRERILRLRPFGIDEYDLGGLVRSLVRCATDIILKHPSDEYRYRQELLEILYQIYRREGEGKAKFPQATIYILTQDRTWKAADEVHLSETYGLEGRINQALYAHRASALLAPAAEHGLDANADVASFFLWIGVNRWPRAVTLQTPKQFRNAVLTALPEQFEVRDSSGHVQMIDRADISWEYLATFKCEWIEDLDAILSSAPNAAILAWLARDQRFDAITTYKFPVTLKARRNGSSNLRQYNGELPDLVKLTLAETPWLLCRDGIRRLPGEAMRNPGRFQTLFARPHTPDEDAAEAYGLDHTVWERGLTHAGVPANLQELGESRIVEVLSGLEARDLKPEVVRSLYIQVLDLEDFRRDRVAPHVIARFAQAKVQARIGSAIVWRHPAEVYYADRDGVPGALREHLALIDLPVRRSATHVAERLGVSPLSKQPFRITIVESSPACDEAVAALRHKFDAARRFVRALRSETSSETARLRALDDLTVVPVTVLNVALEVAGTQSENSFAVWTHLLDGKRLFVVIDDTLSIPRLTLMASEAIADGLAEFFELQSGTEFAKLLTAETDETRLFLLRRALPSLSDEEVQQLLGPIDDPEPEEPRFNPSVLAAAPKPANTAEIAEPPKSTLVDSNDEGASERDVSSIAATRIENHSQPKPELKTRIKLRVARSTGPIGTSNKDPYRGADAEHWALMFEEAEGRFPLSVAHLQGENAFGCDVLSFSSLADRDTFKATNNENFVTRYIEVKSGDARLTRNEVRAARRKRERYFIYRIVFSDAERTWAELTLVSNPLSHTSAIERTLSVRMDQVADRETYNLSPTSLVDTPLDHLEEKEAEAILHSAGPIVSAA
jgi:hypothetical protein